MLITMNSLKESRQARRMPNWHALRKVVFSATFVGFGIVAALIPLLTNGSAVEVAVAAPEGRPGGYQYTYSPTVAIGLAGIIAVLALCRFVSALRLRYRLSTYHSIRSSISSALLSSTFTSGSLAIVLAVWLLTTDILGLVSPSHIPPAGRIAQLFGVEAAQGRLHLAAGVTAARACVALFLATCGALIGTLCLGEFARLRLRSMPWLRALALVPPAVLLTFSPWINQLLLAVTPVGASAGNFERWLESMLGGRSILTRVGGQPGHLLFLSSVALWPLLISGIDQYGKLSAQLLQEIRELRLPRAVAVFHVKLPNLLLAVGPAFHVAIVLLLVVSYSVEGNGATDSGVDGLFGLYLHSTQESARDLLVFGVIAGVLVGLAELFLFSTILAYLSGTNPTFTIIRNGDTTIEL